MKHVVFVVVFHVPFSDLSSFCSGIVALHVLTLLRKKIGLLSAAFGKDLYGSFGDICPRADRWTLLSCDSRHHVQSTTPYRYNIAEFHKRLQVSLRVGKICL